MALWSVALFGHYKPRSDGWEKRAEPGDIIAVKPFIDQNRWTDTERKEFLIVTIEDFEPEQLNGLIEPQWDLNSYPVIPEVFISKLKAKGKTLYMRPDRIKKKRRFHVPLDDLRDIGVDIDKMLNKEMRYDPNLEAIAKIRCYDKLKMRYAQNSDGFNLLPPIPIGKMLY